MAYDSSFGKSLHDAENGILYSFIALRNRDVIIFLMLKYAQNIMFIVLQMVQLHGQDMYKAKREFSGQFT